MISIVQRSPTISRAAATLARLAGVGALEGHSGSVVDCVALMQLIRVQFAADE